MKKKKNGEQINVNNPNIQSKCKVIGFNINIIAKHIQKNQLIDY
jgi:hypothetical protein